MREPVAWKAGTAGSEGAPACARLPDEAEFVALRYFTLDGTDHRNHAERGKAIADYMRWRNANPKPTKNFAINSKIRLPEYQAKVLC